jgi:NAD(P)H-dependent FMN reductase
MTKILAFSGSSSSTSINQQLVSHAASLIDGAAVTLIDIRDFPLPVHSVDLEEGPFPDNAQKLKALFAEHDGFLISSPEYNGSMPAIFKNMIDWLSRMEGKIFEDKPVLILSTSPGRNGGATNLANLVKLLPWWGADLVGSLAVGGFNDVFDKTGGRLSDTKLAGELEALVAKLETQVLAGRLEQQASA